MAEEAKATAVADPVKSADKTTNPTDTPAESAAVEEKQSTGGDAAASGEASKDAQPSPANPDASAEAEVDIPPKTQEAMEETAANGTPAVTPAATPAKDNRRKSGSGVPEHKKKTPGKKKAAPELRLNVKPGEMYMVTKRGFPPWPSIICDEEMLPEALLSKRPVSAMRIDGTYRADFQEGGKHAKDRRYPVMFLGTNEFAWEVNTNLQPMDINVIKEELDAGNTGKKKKSKNLWEAFEVAAQGHDLQYFKDLLSGHDEAMQIEAEEQAAVEAKKETKKKRKSSAAVADEDIEMEDSPEEEASSKKSKAGSKKRKKTDESEGEPEKPVKTPKTKLKLTTKPKDASATKPKETKTKKAKETVTAKPEEKPLSAEERRDKEEKSVLYLRHRLQKGFLTRDQPPKEGEMPGMSEYMKTLEEIENISAEAIKKTKVHKVLRAIIKLDSIPKEEEYNFKKRCTDLLQRWSGALQATDGAASGSVASQAATKVNGVSPEKKGSEEKEEKADEKADQKNGDEKQEDEKMEDAAASEAAASEEKADNEKKTEAADDTKATDADGDVSMVDAKTESAGAPSATPADADEKDAKAAEAATKEPVNSA